MQHAADVAEGEWSIDEGGRQKQYQGVKQCQGVLLLAGRLLHMIDSLLLHGARCC